MPLNLQRSAHCLEAFKPTKAELEAEAREGLKGQAAAAPGRAYASGKDDGTTKP